MNNGDKGGITSLIKLIRQKKTKKQRQEHKTINPIICIGNYNMDKKIRELMKVCHSFELRLPTDKQIYEMIKPMNIVPMIQDKIVNYIQGDLRKLVFITKIHKKNPHLLNEDTLESIFHIKSYSEDSKQITRKLLQNKVPLTEHNRYMNETDRTIIALLLHENIVDVIANYPNERTVPFYQTVLDNFCFADFMDRITFQHQIWQFNEMSSLMKTFYNIKKYHQEFPIKTSNLSDIRFTKVLTKYSTEYNNSIFIYDLCQSLDMDKNDLVTFFQELRLKHGENITKNNNFIDSIFDEYDINKLDIKRVYRYLDKNIKKDIIEEESEDEFDE
jgi:hypothetical protein